MNNALFSSKEMAWTTPRELFDWLNLRFGFTLDPCCLPETALCPKYYTPQENGLAQPWRGERVFMNPPYGRNIGQWIAKAESEAHRGALVVALVPARTDTAWWQNHVIGKASICYLSGRLKFGNSKQSAPFPSAILVYWGGDTKGKL